MRDAFNYRAIASCFTVFACAPTWLARRLAVGIAFFWQRYATKDAERALRHSRDRLGLDERAASAFVARNFRHYLTGMMEAAKLLRLNSSEVLARIDDTGFADVMKKAHEAPGGVVIASCHMGNWIWLSTYLGIKGFIAGHIINPFANPRIDALVTRIRTRHGCVLWHKKGAMIRAAKALKDRRAFSLMLDLDLGEAGIMSPFLGKPASTNTIPIELAVRMKSAVVVAALVRTGDTPLQFTMLFSDPIMPQGNGPEEVKRIVDEINNRLSAMILAHPSQWWWQYRRWRTRKTAPACMRRRG